MTTRYDLAVIGGGAAGLAAAQYGARANLSVLLIEEMAHGGQALLIDNLENYPGIASAINGYDFSEAMHKQALSFGAVFMSASVSALTRQPQGFVLETTGGPVEALSVVIATGAKHRRLDIPGETEFAGRGVSYCATCDGPFFKGKRIVVVGGGDSACDEAMFLAKLSDRVLMVHRRERFRAQRALSERVLRNPSIEVRFNTGVREIRGERTVTSVLLEDLNTQRRYEESADAVFIFVGSIPQTALVPEVEKDEGGSIISDERMLTNVPGLFAAGDVRATPFRQIVTACADGAVAAHSAAAYIDEIKGQSYA